ncbi:unnamed protein product [Caenorhabditis angaria]|uniref:Uncharacterized protein n=1 Tax=Caenorhabditis angaria TaxID=860376 RepID=A0A9P1MVH6_9PELO|nr:unnamed protein product [Caenorhabditis angaria]
MRCIKNCIYFLFIFIIISKVNSSDDEYRLLNDLREGYDPIERPVVNHHKPIEVKFRLLLQQLVDVDEKNQLITLVAWIQYKWSDYKWKWDPEEYGNITKLQIPHGVLWKPDILLFNSANEHFDSSFPVNMVVSNNGSVLFAPPGIMQISCSLTMTWFPYDEQVCYLKFGSWTYADKIDLQIDDFGLDDIHKMDLSYYVPNGEFDLLATPAKRIQTTFENETYIELYFHLHLKRRVLYYGINWILPSVLISLSNILGFTMPPECGEKITLQITNLLSVTVFLGMVAEVTPPTSESIPVIAAFFSLSIVILGLSIFATLIIINIFFRHPRSHVMGEWTHFIFLEWLPWLLLMSRPEHTFKKPKKSKRNETDEENGNGDEEKQSIYESAENHVRPRLLINSQVFNEPAIQCLEDIITLLRKFQTKLEEDEEEEEQIMNWRFMAMVIDRLSLFLFTALILGTTGIVFLATPKLFSADPIIDV